jgi:SsrA-binding protein
MSDYTTNKKAHFNYTFLDKFEAGIELVGHEVKAIRSGKVSIEGARVIVRGGEAYVVGMRIEPYQAGNVPPAYDISRTRKLLLNKKEIKDLEKAGETKGLTIVPISLYNKRGKVKVSVAISKGNKTHDKRESIKKRETDRTIRREFKSR